MRMIRAPNIKIVLIVSVACLLAVASLTILNADYYTLDGLVAEQAEQDGPTIYRCADADDKNCVDVYPAGRHLRIPGEYLRAVATPNDTDSNLAAIIELILPEFAPVTTENREQFQVKHRRNLRVVLHTSPANLGHVSSRAKVPPTAKFQEEVAERYEELGLRGMKYMGSEAADYLASPDGKYLLRCSGILDAHTHAPQCSVRLVLRGNVEAFASFSNYRFNEFTVIERTLDDMLQSWEMPSKGNP